LRDPDDLTPAARWISAEIYSFHLPLFVGMEILYCHNPAA